MNSTSLFILLCQTSHSLLCYEWQVFIHFVVSGKPFCVNFVVSSRPFYVNLYLYILPSLFWCILADICVYNNPKKGLFAEVFYSCLMICKLKNSYVMKATCFFTVVRNPVICHFEYVHDVSCSLNK